MRITDLLKKEGIDLQGRSATKEETINHLVDLMDATGNLKDKAGYKAAVIAREEQGTTGIGEGIAIPHGKTAAVKEAGLAVMVCKEGTDYDAMDGQPAHLLFAIAVPDNSEDTHLEVLSRLSMMLMDEGFRQELINAKDKDTFLKLIDAKEKEKFGAEDAAKEAEKETAAPTKKDGYQILAVTACPTGIAHTYMAAEALENKAADMGVSIKVETDGSGGVKNALTAEEIENADAIIVAADKNVPMARFDGKHVLQTKVADGIHKPEELINNALEGKAPIYHADSAAEETADSGEKQSIGRKIYKDLMNGVSHMLPFVIGGGILIALAFLFDDYSIDPSNFGMNRPFAAFLKTIGDGAFGFMLPILAGYIAMSIADRPGLAVGFVGGYLAKEGFILGNVDGAMTITAGGTSGFIGALLAGFVAGYLVLGLRKLFDKLPDSLEGIKPTLLYPFFGLLIMGALMVFVINPPVAALNTAMTNGLNSMGESSKVVLGLVLGGMMAIDMGGPFNKAAYVFGTAAISSGQYDIMAAVMIGGMVPPIGIALCATFFKNRFTSKERQSAMTNYIMGLCFITEGAIPFAAADPIRVIPSCVVGAAVAGALSMLFGCTLMAPHGGVFVFPVVGNPLFYVLSLLVGSIVTMILLAILKKPLEK
ncbi:MAG: fructose-specific PTS transporter subunit EIIC [Eubacterium sp.]|nr:fructose-specific PTS transporter subunit EIIC [Eubacterium sp.]